MIKTPLAKLITLKAATIALATATAGGVALAAGTGVLHTSARSNDQNIASAKASGGAGAAKLPPAAVSVPAPAKAHLPATAPLHAPVSVPGTTGGVPSPTETVAHLCRTLAANVEQGKAKADETLAQALSNAQIQKAFENPALAQALHNPQVAALSSYAGSMSNVPNMCATVLHFQLPPSLPSGLPGVLPGTSGLPLQLPNTSGLPLPKTSG